MPQLDSSVLQGHREQVLAHLQLANIAVGYVWGSGDHDVVKVSQSVMLVMCHDAGTMTWLRSVMMRGPCRG